MGIDAPGGDDARVLRDACELLGVERLVLAIHGPSFPGDATSDVGAGCPASAAGERFLAFVRRLGFTGVQLGPQGETSEDNPSPYDGTLFARSRLTIALDRLVRDGLLDARRLDALVAA